MSEAEPDLIDSIRLRIRRLVRGVARQLDHFSGHRITPSMVTITGVVLHVLIALLIASRHNFWAAVALVIFGLFDTLDGELARLQKRASAGGMFLDASTDRIKEVMLYMGAAWAFASLNNPYMGMWAVAACGASLLVSYVKAKGEAAVADSHLSFTERNKLFQDGFMRFEVRMVILIIGLLFNLLAIAVGLIAILAAGTALARLVRITRYLNRPQVADDDQS